MKDSKHILSRIRKVHRIYYCILFDAIVAHYFVILCWIKWYAHKNCPGEISEAKITPANNSFSWRLTMPSGIYKKPPEAAISRKLIVFITIFMHKKVFLSSHTLKLPYEKAIMFGTCLKQLFSLLMPILVLFAFELILN